MSQHKKTVTKYFPGGIGPLTGYTNFTLASLLYVGDATPLMVLYCTSNPIGRRYIVLPHKSQRTLRISPQSNIFSLSYHGSRTFYSFQRSKCLFYALLCCGSSINESFIVLTSVHLLQSYCIPMLTIYPKTVLLLGLLFHFL